MAKLKVGILTSGGDCPGLNATIRGAAKGCYQLFGEDKVEIIGIHNGYYGLIHNDCEKMSPYDFTGILTRGGTILGTKRTPYKMMQVIEEDNVNKVSEMKKTYKTQKLDCLLLRAVETLHDFFHFEVDIDPSQFIPPVIHPG